VAEWIGWVGTEDGVSNGKRILSRRGSFRLEVHFLEPFDPQGLAGRKAIAAQARRRIEPWRLEAALADDHWRPFAFDVAPVRDEAAKNAA
jgi:1-acyl-sn-glycerol-3-phosphate acyltransferase